MSILKGKTMLITGAGSGIGRTVAKRAAEKGVSLILIGRNRQKLEETKKLCLGVKVDCFSVDMQNPEEMKAFFEQELSFDYLINNAGVALTCPLENTTLEQYETIMNTNVRGPFLMCKYSLPILRKSEVPTVINIGSVVAHTGYEEQSIYGASKHAIAGMTKALAKEVYKEGIRVHLINPGGVLTDMVRLARPDLPPDEGDMILPEDIADLICFILEHRSNAIVDEINVHRRTKEPFL